MRIAQRVQQVLAEHPGKIGLEHQRITFRPAGGEDRREPGGVTKQQISRFAIAVWAERLGAKRSGSK